LRPPAIVELKLADRPLLPDKVQASSLTDADPLAAESEATESAETACAAALLEGVELARADSGVSKPTATTDAAQIVARMECIRPH